MPPRSVAVPAYACSSGHSARWLTPSMTASVVVPVAVRPISASRTPRSLSAAAFASVAVMMAFTIAAGVILPSTTSIMLIVPGVQEAGNVVRLTPARAALDTPAVTQHSTP
ncbi:hypothetical protein D3C77_376420 [compost metagenome]